MSGTLRDSHPQGVECKMGKGAALLGLILIIVGILPILMPMIGFDLGQFAAFFDLGLFSYPLAGYVFTEVMLICLGLGVILFLVGLVR
jgi:hypothetical protein